MLIEFVTFYLIDPYLSILFPLIINQYIVYLLLLLPSVESLLYTKNHAKKEPYL
jgi:hypothetical protein